jgi:hypothetical protein
VTEDELFAGITGALELAGWRWMHIRRSDGVTVGDSGWVDIFAVHPTRLDAPVLAWELKGTGGRPTGDQVAWVSALWTVGDRYDPSPIDARLVYPVDYDLALDLILGRVERWGGPLVSSTTAIR